MDKKNINTEDKVKKIKKEIERNYQAFKKMEQNFEEQDDGKFALLKNGKLIEILANKIDAHRMGIKLFEDEIYSIQEIRTSPHDLGFMSYALR